MKYMSNLEKVFIFNLFMTLIISFYFFVSHFVLKYETYSAITTTWQFPMILAMFWDSIYNFY
jgi:hypothetical protein